MIVSIGIALTFAGILLSQARERGRQVSCRSNLHSLGLVVQVYALDYDGYFPDKLSHLYYSYLSTLQIFECPSTNDRILPSEMMEEEGSYIYVPGLTQNDPPGTVLLYDKPGNHGRLGRRGRNVVYLDGHVEWESAE